MGFAVRSSEEDKTSSETLIFIISSINRFLVAIVLAVVNLVCNGFLV